MKDPSSRLSSASSALAILSMLSSTNNRSILKAESSVEDLPPTLTAPEGDEYTNMPVWASVIELGKTDCNNATFPLSLQVWRVLKEAKNEQSL